ncbi:hypothetical protein [Clavibacter michiganensis]|nr:hypothetical protein [Clavibacter michiganensis]
MGGTGEAEPDPTSTSTSAPTRTAPREDWAAIEERLTEAVAATEAALPGEWTDTPPFLLEHACMADRGDYRREQWVPTSTGTAVVYSGRASWYEEEDYFDTLDERLVTTWSALGLEVESGDIATRDDEALASLSFAYGVAVATIPGSDQMRFVGGFDGDNWIVAATVSCDTPGFPRPAS